MTTTPSAEDADGRPLVPPLPTLQASELGRRLTASAFHDIRRLASVLSRVNLDSRREDLLDYIRPNRARFLKAYAIISWLSGNHGHGELVVNASRALAEARAQREQIDTCQDQFFFMHGGLFGARQRLYDVPVAVDVLIGGSYPRLPRGIQYCGGDIDPRPLFELPTNRQEIELRVDRAIRLALLRRGGVPDHFTSHAVRNGVLTLVVDGEFELMVTLQGEREDAKWTLLKVTVMVQAREGESITAPAADYRQQRYLQEVVQKAMDVHTHQKADASLRPNPLLAAYQVCHDMCCSMVLEILHAQARKLATRVGGLWASQLVVLFHKDSQVLDLCLWQREFSAGLGGTGRDVGVGGNHVDENPSRLRVQQQKAATTPGFKTATADAASLPPPPVGCRYLRLHRPVDRHSQMVAYLGPPGDLLGGRGGSPGDEAAGAEAFSSSAIQVHPDKLSCSRMLLAAARTFATQKIRTLVTDVENIAAQLGTCVPRVTTASVGGLSACICPWGGGSVEVSVDVKSGRYLVQDNSRPGGSKAMTGCVSRLREALNLLPQTDSRSLGESISATLSAGRSVLQKQAPLSHGSRIGEQQDLRQQQVRRCIGETFGVLRRGDVEHAFRCALGVVPHGRWQALLGRTEADTGSGMAMDAGALSSDLSRLDTAGTLRSSVRLSQFREKGVRLSAEWRKRTRTYEYHMRRREASTIELTRAERAATAGQFGTAAWQRGRGRGRGRGRERGRGALPTLAASLAEVSDGVDDALRSSAGRVDRLGAAANMNTLLLVPPHADETGEVLSFFLEVGINGSLDVEHTVIAASLPTAGRARGSLRPVVAETYTLFPCQPQNGSPCGSLEAALLPSALESEPEPAVAAAAAPLLAAGAKRAASYLDAGDLEGTNGRTGEGQHQGQGSKLHAAAATSTAGSALDAAEAQLHRAVQMYHRLVPFARLQHALLKVGTGLSLDFRELTHFSGGAAQQQVPRCAVFLAGEHGWSRPEVAATSARVSFFAGHTQTDTWEWVVSLGPTSGLMDYTAGVASKGEGAEAAATRELIHEQLPLVKHLNIRAFDGLDSQQDFGGGVVGGKQVQFRFPPPFSVHAMCRSFALAGEGLAAMQTLAAQASTLQQQQQQQQQQHHTGEVGGYRVVSHSPVHVAMRDSGLDHMVLLTHSAFSARHISSAERPGLVLISWPSVPTCPVAMRELEASVRKHRDLNALLHGLSRTLAALAVVSRVVPGVGSASGVGGDRFCEGGGQFVLAAVSPARFVLSEAGSDKTRSGRPPLTLMVEAGGQVRVSRVAQKDVVADTGVLRDLLLEWIASTPEIN